MKELLTKIVKETFVDVGFNPAQHEPQIEHFVNSIEADVVRAVAAENVKSLKPVIEGRLTRPSLGVIYRQRNSFLIAVLTLARVLISKTNS